MLTEKKKKVVKENYSKPWKWNPNVEYFLALQVWEMPYLFACTLYDRDIRPKTWDKKKWKKNGGEQQ